MKDSLKRLLPQNPLTCAKCGSKVKVHDDWKDRETTLCPSCYYRLNEEDRTVWSKAFAKKHANMIGGMVSDRLTRIVINQVPLSTIVSCTDKELVRLHKEGRVSDIRYKIEVKRRKRDRTQKFAWEAENARRANFGV